MKYLRICSFLVCLLFLFSACSKEKRINRWLERKDGKWNIELYEVVEYENGVEVDRDLATGAGTFTFQDGKLTIRIDYNNAVTSYSGNYVADENTIAYEVNGVAQVLTIQKAKKEEFELTGEEHYDFGSDSYINKIRYVLKR